VDLDPASVSSLGLIARFAMERVGWCAPGVPGERVSLQCRRTPRLGFRPARMCKLRIPAEGLARFPLLIAVQSPIELPWNRDEEAADESSTSRVAMHLFVGASVFGSSRKRLLRFWSCQACDTGCADIGLERPTATSIKRLNYGLILR
jgi:hypothetical protein